MPVRCRKPRPEGGARRRAVRVQRARGDRAGRARRPCSARSSSAASSAPRWGSARCRARRVRDAVLLPDRAGGGVVESRALRRRALRLPLADGADRLEMYKRTRDEGFGDEPKRRIMVGTYALSAGYYDAYYGQAQKVRTVLIREHAEAFERFDVLRLADIADGRVQARRATANPLAMYLSDLLTIPSCMAGLPGLNVPCGLSEGLPVGAAADRAAVLREHAVPRRRTRSSARSASTPCRSGCDDDALRGSRGRVRARGRARLRRRAARARRLARRARRRREAARSKRASASSG